jgi:hypothetical protein
MRNILVLAKQGNKSYRKKFESLPRLDNLGQLPRTLHCYGTLQGRPGELIDMSFDREFFSVPKIYFL